MELDILYEDDNLIAINKPHGLLVHRTPIAKDATEFAVQALRNQLDGKHVYPVHRLDRKTSGVLLFAKTLVVNQEVQALFRDRQVSKTYHALVRGRTQDELQIEYALTNTKNKKQDAITNLRTINRYELPFASAGFQTSRYSLVELKPITGRYHQLRKHMAHIFHPIIGDRPHGCNKQNKLWKERFGMTSMLLHATQIALEYPNSNYLEINAHKQDAFEKAFKICEQYQI